MDGLLKNFKIRTKIKLISFVAVAIISLILVVMISFKQFLENNMYKLEK